MGAPLGGYVADALFVAERVIVELDSWPFHKGKPAFETDRERDADTLAWGFVTVRVTEERLDGRPREEAERLHVILAHRRAAQAPNAA
jgi:very-short-patch-repair endonuclease